MSSEDMLLAINLICNTLSAIALAYIAAKFRNGNGR